MEASDLTLQPPLFTALAPAPAAARSLRQASSGEVVVIRDGPGSGMMMRNSSSSGSGTMMRNSSSSGSGMMMGNSPSSGSGMMMGNSPASACSAPTAADLVASSPRLSILASALDADPALKALLSDASTPLTLFAPTDAAMVDFFDTLGVSRKEGLVHPTTAAALRFLVLPGVARRLESFAPSAKALTAVGANLTVLSPEAVANLAKARAMQRAAGENGTQANDSSSSSFFAAFAPVLAPVAAAITRNGTDPDATQFLAALAGLAGSLVQAVTPGAARRRVPRLCEDGCRWTVSGPLTAGSPGASADGKDTAINNATVLLGNGRACGPAFVHILDEVLLPELLGTSGGDGKEAAVVSVGDGQGRLVSRVTVPAAVGGEREVSVELVGSEAAAAPAAAPAGPAPAAPAAAPAAAAPAAQPAISRRVDPEPVDIINPVVAQVVGKQPAAARGRSQPSSSAQSWLPPKRPPMSLVTMISRSPS